MLFEPRLDFEHGAGGNQGIFAAAARPVGNAIEILVDHVVPIGYEIEFLGTAGAYGISYEHAGWFTRRDR